MAVRLTSPVLGLEVGTTYTGNLESWLLNEGYATTAATVPDAWSEDADGILGGAKPSVTVTPTAAVLNGTTNAGATVGTSGNIVFGTKGGVRTTVAVLTGDTAAQAATKIDTALNGLADAAIVSSKLRVTSIATGPEAYVVVVDGTAGVLTGLGVVKGASAHGGDGRPTGASNIGAQADVPENDPTAAENREDAPYWPVTPDLNATIANDAENLTQETFPAPVNLDFDPDGEDDDAPSRVELSPVEGPEEGGTVVTITGQSLVGVTSVTFGGTAGIALDTSDAAEGTILVTTPAKAPGAVDVVLVDADGNTTVDDGFEFLATP